VEEIRHLEQSLLDARARLQQQITQDSLDKQNLRNDAKKFKDEALEWQQKYQALLGQKMTMEQALASHNIAIAPRDDDEGLFGSPPRQQQQYVYDENELPAERRRPQSGGGRKLPKVKMEDVKKIGILLSLRMRAQRISYDEAESKFFPERIASKGFVTIREVEQVLQGEPFRMTEEGQALLVARYMIEDNSSEYVVLDRDKRAEVSVLRSVLKNFLGRYELLTGSEEQKIMYTVKMVKRPWEIVWLICEFP
jgi:FtsZ-binding cell division protein ZapB